MNAVMAKDYSNLLKSPQWFNKRKTILSRDDNKCRCCGSVDRLHVHHRQYHLRKQTGKFKLPWKYQNKYLITLCENCHKAGHQNLKVPFFKI